MLTAAPFICNSPKWDTKQMFISKRVDKPIVVWIHTGEHYAAKMEQITNICNNMDTFLCIHKNMPNKIRRQQRVQIQLHEILEKGNTIYSERTDQWNWLQRGMRELFGGKCNILYVDRGGCYRGIHVCQDLNSMLYISRCNFAFIFSFQKGNS